jgi:thymidylate synthase
MEQNGEESYLQILKTILETGQRKKNRTGIDTFAIPPTTITHDMRNGFPLLTTKKVPFGLIASELEFFIKGLTDKKWLQDRNNHIWDQWCRPSLIPADLSIDERIAFQKQENDLGPVYGYQWRNFGEDSEKEDQERLTLFYDKGSCDQLKTIVDKLHTNPDDRRMVCSAWAPMVFNEQALPPCHLMWIVNHINGVLHLQWTQRSVDVGLGLPFNLASYALLLHLLCKESGMEAGTVSGSLVDCHIYENHVEPLKIQLLRTPNPLPSLETCNWSSIFDWKYTDSKIIGYEPHPPIKMEIAV